MVELRQVYADTVKEIAENDDRVVVLEADLSSSMSTIGLKQVLGKRYVNVGIMEAEEVGLAAGLSVTGFIPFVHTFVPFITRRSFDQVFLSLGYSRRHAILVGSDVGITTEMNGGTHMSFEDLALMRAVPNITIFEPSNAEQFRDILHYCHENEGLYYIRTMRKSIPQLSKTNSEISKGYRVIKEGTSATIISSGFLLPECVDAANQLDDLGHSIGVIELFNIKPINEEMVIEVASKGPIVTVDNHNIIGGIGSAVSEVVCEEQPTLVKRLGVVESFGQVGKTDYLKEVYHMTASDIIKETARLLEKTK